MKIFSYLLIMSTLFLASCFDTPQVYNKDEEVNANFKNNQFQAVKIETMPPGYPNIIVIKDTKTNTIYTFANYGHFTLMEKTVEPVIPLEK